MSSDRVQTPDAPRGRSIVLGVAALLLLAATVQAGTAPLPETPPPGLDGAAMLLGLLGGLTFFLYGLDQMSAGLKAAAGEQMKDFLARFTTNRFSAACTGALVTAVIQSSSVTTVLVVGFASAGLMTLTQSVGVVMGANVGTTLTAQIVAFKVEKAAMVFVIVGFVALFTGRRDRVRQIGHTIMGLGLVFYGMGLMSAAMSPLRSHAPFIEFMHQVERPGPGILLGAAFTALVQSSSATTGIVIALATQGLIGLAAGIALIFGANIGTCVTAFLATLGKPRIAMRVALVHVLFNVTGVIIWIPFLSWLASFVQQISPAAPQLEGSARLAAEVPRQLANAHAVFNVTNTVLLLPLAHLIGRLVEVLVPDRPDAASRRNTFLDLNALRIPAVAINNARLEVELLGKAVLVALRDLPGAFLSGDRDRLEAIARGRTETAAIEGGILTYLEHLRKEELTTSEARDFRCLMVATDALKRIGDMTASKLVKIAHQTLDEGRMHGDTVKELLGSLHEAIAHAVEDAVEAVGRDDPTIGQRILDRQDEIDALVAQVFAHQEERFRRDESQHLEKFRTEMDLVEKQRHIYSLARRIAYTLPGLGSAPTDRPANT